MKWIYRITYPNGKIYVGKDLTGSANYFGSANSDLIARDFTFDQLRCFQITRELLWWSADAADADVNAKEIELILANKSNDPEVGYNQSPRSTPAP